MKPSTKNFFVELQKRNPKKYNLSVISDLENKTQNTYEEIKEFRIWLSTELANHITTMEGFQNRIYQEELNEYSDINDKLLDVGIAGTDFTTAVNENIENSIAEIDGIKSLLL
jgi:hypothetical protein|tara:strand:- start:467 stop:805 length:339 start_codon:yes stop_codon:yes gene_type:complete